MSVGMEGQGDNFVQEIASLHTDVEQTRTTLQQIEALLTNQSAAATVEMNAAVNVVATAAAAAATPTFHGPVAPPSPNLEAARPRLPETFGPSTKGSDVRRFVATLEIYFEAIGCSTLMHDAARFWPAATMLRGPALEWTYYSDVVCGERTWAQFRVDLIERFEPINSTYMAWQQIYRQKQYGSVAQYTQRFFDGEQPLRVLRAPLSSDPFIARTFEDVGWQSPQEEEYRQKVRSLQFAACTTRPDISFACSKLGSGQTVRSDQHWKELDQCLAYLVGSRDVALEFGGGPESLELVGYADADDVGDKQNKTSTGGYVFVLGGAAVSWASQRIRCTTLSSTEYELIAAVEAGKEARRLRFLLAEFQLLRSEEPTTLFVDNSSAISVAGGMGLKGSLKHMERCHMWLQHMVKHRKMQL
ncbi:unnamed protein product [Closterium sp. NIES-54]